ncbi:calcium-binding protein [Methylopila musalis]|uniref:Calcium-binding protein n=1 Tax=Methylopila musalis TaxID=1134781 RepID=A0ABW3Z6R7_9HYPH
MPARTGTDGNDTLSAFNYNEALLNNIYNGKGGNDYLQGGYMADSLYGEAGNDTISGSDGGDYISDTSGTTYANGDSGDDFIFLSNGVATAIGGSGADVFNFSAITSFNAYGDVGDDAATFTNSSGTFYGGAGDDSVTTLNGAGKSVAFYGGAGDDTLIASSGTDIFYGEAGDDTVSYSASASAVTVDLLRNAAGGAAAGDRWSRVENVEGSYYNDNIRGNGDYNFIFGGFGNDVISGGAGGDNLDGGLGVDRLDYSRSDAAVTVNLATGEAGGGHAEGDQFQGFESLEGSGYADRLTGDAGVNRIAGGGGADRLIGGGGGDVISGGAGADRFVYLDVTDSRMSSGRDTIYDFKRSDGDRIDLSAIDASISGSGNQAFTFIGTGAFASGTQGQLSYRAYGGYVIVQGDINGDRIGDFSIQVQNVASLAASDFVL